MAGTSSDGDAFAELLAGTIAIERALLSYGRLRALALLGEPDIYVRPALARRSVEFIDEAAQVRAFLETYFSVTLPEPVWYSPVHPERAGILADGQLDRGLLEEVADGLLASVSATVEELRAVAGSSILSTPWLLVLDRIARLLPTPAAPAPAGPLPRLAPDAARVRPGKTLAGPRSVPLDPRFRPGSHSVLQESAPHVDVPLRRAAQDYWILATREGLAAELTALSLIEWDGLPIGFYRDLAKQTWDETRHAVFAFETAVSLLPELLAELDDDDPMRRALVAFQEGRLGLPVPRERDLYETILNATLVERLVLMHHDTETPGISSLERKRVSEFGVRHPAIAAGLGLVERDERTHARLGHRWLHHLLPQRQEREAAIERARLMRSILLLTACAAHGSDSLEVLISRALPSAD